jgi:HK97 family phage prohead protease
MEVRYAVIPCEAKEVEDRTLEITGSTETQDRAGDIIRQEGWDLKNYKKNPVFMWAHDYKLPPIGRATKVWIDKASKALKFHIEFASPDIKYPESMPSADTIYRLYKSGFMKATSVGFRPLDWEGKSGDDDMPKYSGNVFTKQELWELSACAIPANPDALSEAVRRGILTEKEAVTIAQPATLDASTYLFPTAQEILDAEIVDLTEPEVTKPEENDETIRIPVDSGNHDDHRIRTIAISEKEGISALYCATCKKVITYLFRKSKGWTMDKAKQWVKEHEKSSEAFITLGEKVTQSALLDEIDYLDSMVREIGISNENASAAMRLSALLLEKIPVERPEKRNPGGDMPVKYEPTADDLKRIKEYAVDYIKREITLIKGK